MNERKMENYKKSLYLLKMTQMKGIKLYRNILLQRYYKIIMHNYTINA